MSDKQDSRDNIFESLDTVLKLDASELCGFVPTGSTDLTEDETDALKTLQETAGWADLIRSECDRYDVRNFIISETCVPAGIAYGLSEKVLRGLTEETLTEADIIGDTDQLNEGMASSVDDEVQGMTTIGAALDGSPPPVDPQGVGDTDADRGCSQNEPRGDKREIAQKGYSEEAAFESIMKITDPEERIKALSEMWNRLAKAAVAETTVIEGPMTLPNQTPDPESGAPDYDSVERVPPVSDLDVGPADPGINHDSSLMHDEKPNDKTVKGQNEALADDAGAKNHLNNIDGDYIHAGDHTDQGLDVTEAILAVARGVAEELNIKEDSEHWDRLLYKVAEEVINDMGES